MSTRVRREVTVNLESGFHLFPCSTIAKFTQNYPGSVTFQRNGKFADAKSMLDLMMLEAPHGAVLIVEVQGADAPALADAIVRMFESDFALAEETDVPSPLVDERIP